MKKYFILAIISTWCLSCAQKPIDESLSFVLVGKWGMKSVSWFDSPINRDYSKYELEFTKDGSYNHRNEYNKQSYGRYVMTENGAKIILLPATSEADTLSVLHLDNSNLHIGYKSYARFFLSKSTQ